MNVICLALCCHSAISQPAIGMECYGMGSAWGNIPMSRVYLRSEQGNYGEVRYNYDAQRTLGVSMGHSFSGSNGFGEKDMRAWSIDAMTGIMAGAFQGISIGCSTSLEWGKYNFLSVDQLMWSIFPHGRSALYSWSEMGYQMDKYVYFGLTFQGNGVLAAGCLVSMGPEVRLSLKDWIIPVYFFKPRGSRSYSLVGIEREWSLATSKINHQKRTYDK